MMHSTPEGVVRKTASFAGCGRVTVQSHNKAVPSEPVILFREVHPQELVRDVGQNSWTTIFTLAVFITSKLV